MPDVQFDGENSYNVPMRSQQAASGDSFLKKIALKMGAKSDAQVQMILLGISITAIILTFIVIFSGDPGGGGGDEIVPFDDSQDVQAIPSVEDEF